MEVDLQDFDKYNAQLVDQVKRALVKNRSLSQKVLAELSTTATIISNESKKRTPRQFDYYLQIAFYAFEGLTKKSFDFEQERQTSNIISRFVDLHHFNHSYHLLLYQHQSLSNNITKIKFLTTTPTIESFNELLIVKKKVILNTLKKLVCVFLLNALRILNGLCLDSIKVLIINR